MVSTISEERKPTGNRLRDCSAWWSCRNRNQESCGTCSRVVAWIRSRRLTCTSRLTSQTLGGTPNRSARTTITSRPLAKAGSASSRNRQLGPLALDSTRSSAGLSLPNLGSVGHALFLWPLGGGVRSGLGADAPSFFAPPEPFCTRLSLIEMDGVSGRR